VKLRKATVSFFMSAFLPSCLSVCLCLHRTTRLLLEGHIWNLTFGYFSKLYRERSYSI
jgi:hypothetical protein